MLEAIEKLFTHDSWATARALRAIGSAPENEGEPLRLLAHLLQAEKIWFLRLKGVDTNGVSTFGLLTLAACEALAEEIQVGYVEYISSLGEEDLARVVTYRNSEGKEFKTPVGDILLHVALHGTYHRGQIASAIRGVGHVPMNTDFITFVRER